MANEAYKYIWRCAKCSYHFVNIYKAEGAVKQEKKCPKCKSMNTINLSSREIYIHCRFYDPRINDYNDEIGEAYSFPMPEE